VVDPGRGLPRARNLGVELTRGDVVWFLDDDVRLRPGCLEAHRRAYADPWVGGVTGRIDEVIVRPNSRRLRNGIGLGGRVRTRLDGDRPAPLETLKGANMSMRRAALRSAGPCDEGLRGTALLEDAEWSTRVAALGWRLRFEPAAAVVHLSLPAGGCRVADPLATERWRFHNTARFIRRHRPHQQLRVTATFALIAARRAWQWRDPGAVGALIRAWREGWRGG
jgi:GT2 family glycosyltransferase